jgi:hypothetical protein
MPPDSTTHNSKTCIIPIIAYHKKRQIIIFLCAVLIAIIFQRGYQLGLVNSVTDRIRFHAIPVAVSFLYHGHLHDYTANREIALPFQGQGSLGYLLEDSINKKVTQRSNYYWVADDKGFADFIIASFKLFGPKLSSMYKMWFVCLVFTTALFLSSYRNNLWCIGLLGMTLVGIYTAISTIPLVDEANFLNFQSANSISTVSIYEPRFLDVLAMIPVIHICLFTLRRNLSTSTWQIVALLCQIGFFFFLYHARSSLGWQLVAMLGFLSLVTIYRIVHKKRWRVKTVKRFIPPALVFISLVAGLGGLTTYKHFTYNPRYFQDMGVRTFWHNALMGITEPVLAKNHQLAFGDLQAAHAVIEYSQQGTCKQGISQLDPQDLLNSLGGHGEKDWFAYENCAKKLYFYLWKQYPLNMTYNYVVLKPEAALNVFWGAAKNVQAKFSDVTRSQFVIGWYPLSFIPFIFGAAIFLIAGQSIYRRRAVLICLFSTLLAFSLIPSIMFYSAILTLGGFFVTLTILCHLFIFFGVSMSIRRIYMLPTK